MSEFLPVFNSIAVVISILTVIWLVATKISKLEFKISVLWEERETLHKLHREHVALEKLREKLLDDSRI